MQFSAPPTAGQRLQHPTTPHPNGTDKIKIIQRIPLQCIFHRQEDPQRVAVKAIHCQQSPMGSGVTILHSSKLTLESRVSFGACHVLARFPATPDKIWVHQVVCQATAANSYTNDSPSVKRQRLVPFAISNKG